ncbi:MAG: DNA repair protein RadA [Deferrisomatales bacterium]|nr:DNA repair protein RadA [Deferrisomatales bacterium]
MPKPKRIFECQQCGAQSPKWLGRCTECAAWNSFSESTVGPAPAAAPGRGAFAGLTAAAGPVPLAEVEGLAEARTPCGVPEFDRVLGGGIVAGSAVLVGGDPGIGKSTLLLQVMQRLSRAGQKTLYVSGEESVQQIRMRSDRLGGPPPGLLVLPETDVTRILQALEKERPAAVVIDSVQTLYSADLSGAPGTVSQVREVSGRLVVHAKTHGVPLFLVGHVTKDGAIAGPRVLEHMVDTVLYFEGDGGHPYRMLRAVKNRFGSTNEVGVFAMGDGGLREVPNPSALFLSERPEGASGSAVFPCLEGTRTLLAEVQALVTPAAFASPQRTTSGVERNRVQILAALLERKAGLDLLGQDLFVNAVGGIRIAEPAADLALVAALASAFRDRPLPGTAVFFGEVGLAGEVRRVSRPDARLAEAAKLGFDRAYAPPGSAAAGPRGGKLQVTEVRDLRTLLDACDPG